MARFHSSSSDHESMSPMESEWKPKLQIPRIGVYGLEDLSVAIPWEHESMEDYLRSFGRALSKELVEGAHSIEFPATDPTTLVEQGDKDSLFFPMRYVPNLFKKPKSLLKMHELLKSSKFSNHFR